MLNNIKKILLLLILIPLASKAQYNKVDSIQKDTNLINAANSMMDFYNQKRESQYFMFAGIGLGAISSGLSISGKTNGEATVAGILGGVSLLIGFILNIDSYHHIKKSSVYLMNAGNNIGVGVKF